MIKILACDFAANLQILVDATEEVAVDKTPNGSNLNLLNTKLTSILQSLVGGSSSVAFTTFSDDVRSSLELDITLSWALPDKEQLKIDLAAILDGYNLSDDIK